MGQENGAIYCRLSQDDGSAGESGSIQTQKTLLTQYCKEHNIHVADYYCDDGWSGTSFDRPEFQRMLEDIETGKINTVVVKDLSRFGREYAQMGLYIEHYFEEKGIRFIAVAEGIDSQKGLDNLVLPMTNVINSLYARQASAKTKAAHRARAGSGMFIGSRAPFGYQKDPNDRHHLIVDPEAAEVVKSIFRMFADGIGYVRMTKLLREQNVLNPQAYFNQNNPDYYKTSDYWRKPFDWHATSIRAILNNPVYLGKLVFGRSKTKGFFDKRRVHTEESEWVVAENTHEPLITQEQWDKAAADNVRPVDHAIANGIPHGDIRVAGASAVTDSGVAVLQVVLGKADAVHHSGVAVLHQQAVEIRIDQHQMGVQVKQPRQHRFSGGIQRLARCGNSAARANSGDISILDKDIRHRSAVALGKLRDEATILQKHDTTSSYILIISGRR